MRKFSTRRLISHRLIKEQHAPAFWQQTSLSYFCISEQQQLLSSLNENDLKIKALRDAAEPPLPYWKGNKQAAVADLCCSSCSQRSDANMLQLKSRSFRWAVALSEGKAITANLSVMLLQHFICSQPPWGLRMTVWRMWPQTQRGSISVGSPPPHPQNWEFHRNLISI